MDRAPPSTVQDERGAGLVREIRAGPTGTSGRPVPQGSATDDTQSTAAMNVVRHRLSQGCPRAWSRDHESQAESAATRCPRRRRRRALSDRQTGGPRQLVWAAVLAVAAVAGGRARGGITARPDASPARSATRAGGPLNVLLITADTLGADQLGTYGNRVIATPRLDALAASGILFENATHRRSAHAAGPRVDHDRHVSDGARRAGQRYRSTCRAIRRRWRARSRTPDMRRAPSSAPSSSIRAGGSIEGSIGT